MIFVLKKLVFLAISLTLANAADQKTLDNLKNCDTCSPLTPQVRTAVHNAQQAIAALKEEINMCNSWVPDTCLLTLDGDTPPPSTAKCFEDDQQIFVSKTFLLQEISKILQFIKPRLQTALAKNVLAQMQQASVINLDDITQALEKWQKCLPKKYPQYCIENALRDRFEQALSKVTRLFFNYITPSTLTGSKLDQNDFKTLCDTILKLYWLLDDNFFEKAVFYRALRDQCITCYDQVPSSAIVPKGIICGYVNIFGKKAYDYADDVDDFAMYAAALEVTQNYANAIKLWFLSRSHNLLQTYVFKDLPTFQRFWHFFNEAPAIFTYCQNKSKTTIENTLLNEGWNPSYQKNQILWIDPAGIIMLRIDNTGKLTLGFLRKNPYLLNNKLDHKYLGNPNREAELLKFSQHYGLPFTIPASLDNTISPFWRAFINRNAVMDDAHLWISIN